MQAVHRDTAVGIDATVHRAATTTQTQPGKRTIHTQSGKRTTHTQTDQRTTHGDVYSVGDGHGDDDHGVDG